MSNLGCAVMSSSDPVMCMCTVEMSLMFYVKVISPEKKPQAGVSMVCSLAILAAFRKEHKATEKLYSKSRRGSNCLGVIWEISLLN